MIVTNSKGWNGANYIGATKKVPCCVFARHMAGVCMHLGPGLYTTEGAHHHCALGLCVVCQLDNTLFMGP